MSKQKKDQSDWDLTNDDDAADDIIDQDDAEEDRDVLTPEHAKGNPNANDDRPPGQQDDEQ